jgi:hypothetical protein
MSAGEGVPPAMTYQARKDLMMSVVKLVGWSEAIKRAHLH